MTPIINPFEHDRLAGRMDRPEVALADSRFITVDVSDEWYTSKFSKRKLEK